MKSLADPQEARLLVDRLRHVTPQSVRRWGRMTVQEMVCHLADAYRHSMGEIPASPVDTLLTRNVIKPFALWLPVPWPPGYPTRPEVDPAARGQKTRVTSCAIATRWRPTCIASSTRCTGAPWRSIRSSAG